jgi:hypothetical protein
VAELLELVLLYRDGLWVSASQFLQIAANQDNDDLGRRLDGFGQAIGFAIAADQLDLTLTHAYQADDAYLVYADQQGSCLEHMRRPPDLRNLHLQHPAPPPAAGHGEPDTAAPTAVGPNPAPQRRSGRPNRTQPFADPLEEISMEAISFTGPHPAVVGERAAGILVALHANPEYDRLAAAAALYADRWATFTGYPIIAHWDLAADSRPLLQEALRVLALKSAVYTLTGDEAEAEAELMVPAPVQEMVHAVLAQFTLCSRIQDRTGFALVHASDRGRDGWESGDYTDQCYQAAGWGTPPARYWISAAETRRRLVLLCARYEAIGIQATGRSHDFDFGIRDVDSAPAGSPFQHPGES